MLNKEQKILETVLSFIETQKQVCELVKALLPDYATGMEQAYWNIENLIKVNLENEH